MTKFLPNFIILCLMLVPCWGSASKHQEDSLDLLAKENKESENQNGNHILMVQSLNRISNISDETPQNIKLNDRTSTSITITWDARPTDVDWEYIVLYGVTGDMDRFKRVNKNEYRAENLVGCTNYEFKVRYVDKDDNESKSSEGKTFKTQDEDSPPPQNIEADGVTDTEMKLKWDKPATACDVTYTVEYVSQQLWGDFAINISLFESQTETELLLTELPPYTMFNFTVTAKTTTENNSSADFMVSTNPGAPDDIGNITAYPLNHLSLRVRWDRPEAFNGLFQNYTITWTSKDDSDSDVITNEYQEMYTIFNVKSNTEYAINLTAYSNGGGSSKTVSKVATLKDPTIGIAIGIPLTILGLALIGGVVIFFLKGRNGRKKQSHQNVGNKNSDTKVQRNNIEHKYNNHIRNLEVSENKNINLKYEKIESESEKEMKPYSTGLKKENVMKNTNPRYLPYDFNRVRIENTDGSNDYINASYISVDYDSDRFILTQNPQENNLKEFFEMIWQQNVETIVCIANIFAEENGKCYKYWAANGVPLVISEFSVYIEEENTKSNEYVFRTLKIQKGRSYKNIKQINFTCWPDNEFPTAVSMNNFIQFVKAESGKGSEILVHCSNGVGKSGVFICLWYIFNLLKYGKNHGTIDVTEVVLNLRKQRPYIIHSKEYYMFLVECIVTFVRQNEGKNNYAKRVIPENARVNLI